MEITFRSSSSAQWFYKSMTSTILLALAPGASAFASSAVLKPVRPSLVDASSFLRTGAPIAQEDPSTYEEYLRSLAKSPILPREAAPPPNARAPLAPPVAPPIAVPMPPPAAPPEPVVYAPTPAPGRTFTPFQGVFAATQGAQAATGPLSDNSENYVRTPWWQQSSDYSETQRENRRTIFMHDDWVRHRSNERFLRNMISLPSSGINQALSKELTFVTSVAAFVVLFNMLLYSYQDLGGVAHPGLLNFLDANINALALPALPFSIAMPALSLLLVFRTNTAYSRWNEARTLWGGLINNCRNIVRQSNTFFPDDEYHAVLKRRMAAETASFIRSLRNFLRGPTDDDTLRGELYELVDAGHISAAQADATMSAANRPMFALSAMSATLRKAKVDNMSRARIDQTISTLVDLTGANERIFKSPIPLVYTRLTARFLTVFLVLMPLGLWQVTGESWNHWATIPATFGISFFLFGIEEVGIQIEEPFSVLPLEAFCNGAIAATNQEMLGAENSGVFDR